MNNGLHHLRVSFGRVLIGVLWALAVIVVGLGIILAVSSGRPATIARE